MRSLFCAILLLSAPIQAVEPAEAAVVGMASVRVAELWDAPVLKPAQEALQNKASRFQAEISSILGISLAEIERVTMLQYKMTSGEDELVPPPVVVVVARKPLDATTIAKATKRKVLHARGKVAELPDATVLEGEDHDRLAVSGRTLVLVYGLQQETPTRAAMEAGLGAILKKSILRDADRGEVMAKDKLAASVVIDVAEVVKAVSGGLGDGEGEAQQAVAFLQPILKARIATASLAIGPALTLKADFTFANADHAVAAGPAVELAVKQLQRMLDAVIDQSRKEKADSATADLAAFAAGLLSGSAVKTAERTTTLTVTQLITPEVSKAAVQAVRAVEAAAGRAQSQNNLKQIALAAHNNSDANSGGLLENICDAKGKPLLSWRVRMLPYLEQNDLYNQFKLDEPWDSEHNKKLIAKMPKVFAVPAAVNAKEGMTFYQAFSGKPKQLARPLMQDGEAKGLNIASITDGTSLTVMVAEATTAVEWTKPADIPFDNDKDPPKLGGHYEGGFNVAMCDGSVRFLKSTIDPTLLKAIITANGGECVMLDD